MVDFTFILIAANQFLRFGWVYLSIILVWLIISALFDIRTREVPDWISFGLGFFAFGARIIFSLLNHTFNPVIDGLLGLFFGCLVGFIMFYTHQWGGGDTKLIVSLGIALGVSYHSFFTSPFFAFVFLFIFVAALYSMAWLVFLLIKNWEKARNHFFRKLKKNKKPVKWLWILSLLVLVLALPIFSLINFLFLLFLILSFNFIFYLWFLISGLEKITMIKKISPQRLTEGDWVAETVKVKSRTICSPKDYGLEKKQISALKKLYQQKKITGVKIKQGVPFIPSFLITFLLFLFFALASLV